MSWMSGGRGGRHIFCQVKQQPSADTLPSSRNLMGSEGNGHDSRRNIRAQEDRSHSTVQRAGAAVTETHRLDSKTLQMAVYRCFAQILMCQQPSSWKSPGRISCLCLAPDWWPGHSILWLIGGHLQAHAFTHPFLPFLFS